MARINRNYEKLPGSYLFSEIARRTAAYQEANPDARLIKMGIGDVTRPLAPAVVAAMHAAVDDLAAAETFHGYGPEQGYAFLRDAIAEHDFAARNIAIDPDEIFVSDGAKSDCGNIGDIFAEDNVVAVCDPVYPVYVDTNAMAGRAGDYDADAERWTNIVYMPTTAENDFTPALPDAPVDLIYLCSPNNPTGTVLSREALQKWVDLRQRHRRRHPLRCRLRALHHRPRHSPLHLRDPRREDVRHRVPQLLEDRRLHREPAAATPWCRTIWCARARA